MVDINFVLRDNLVRIKSSAISTLNKYVDLSNGEVQSINRLINLIDCTITDKITFTDITRAGYVMIKVTEISNIMKGYNNIKTLELIRMLDNIDYGE